MTMKLQSHAGVQATLFLPLCCPKSSTVVWKVLIGDEFVQSVGVVAFIYAARRRRKRKQERKQGAIGIDHVTPVWQSGPREAFTIGNYESSPIEVQAVMTAPHHLHH